MADVYNDAGEAAPQSAKVGRAVNLAGGLISLGLLIGTGVWGYKLLVRDVTGVPVVRALAGPIRVAPENPGGVAAAHQGLAVNQVAAAGSAAGPTDQVILAPAPLDLKAEDLPAPRLPRPVLDQAVTPAPEQQVAEAPVGIDDTPEDALATDMAVAEALSDGPPLDLPEMTGDSTADALALAEALSEGVAPLTGVTDTSADTTGLRDDKGLLRSPRPANRPSDLSRPVASAAPVEQAASGTVEVAADTIPAGTRLVQLGAFESAEVARSQWEKIGGQFEEYFGGKQRVVQRAQSGGKTFYRLRAMGFADLSDARRFCSALMAEKADCIPVVVR
ncbi:SPOR domain-containing protein [Oceaniglobus trochenteri]|uniref:SPOR domain-containing protein n=1 Tax=Oceaniglobus trochenteri TaxID=2763260 RepID=UPI001CFFA3EA|nr:SPOR domain-containing protein [Oceaniglobus trochenteri]